MLLTSHDTHRRPLLLAFVAALAVNLPAQSSQESSTTSTSETKWQQLFNGKDLSGWTPKIRFHEVGINHADTFRVEDGLLKVSYDGYGAFEKKFGHLFFNREFTNYKLRCVYRFVGDQIAGGPGWAFRNSGLMIHGQTAESMTVDQDFPASIEVQLLGGNTKGKRPTANLCTPGTNVVMNGKLQKRHCFNSKSKTYRGDQWVTVLVEARGDTIRHYIDGDTVIEYREPQLDERDSSAKALLTAGKPKQLRGGTISLQSESHAVHFKTVELLELGEPGAWKKPLEGKDLAAHWTTGGNWVLKDGIVTLTPREGERGWSRFDDYLWLKGEYENFEIEFDYKLEERGNSGFYFHVGDQKSPVKNGIEVQIYESSAKGPDAKLTDHDSGGIIPGIPPTRNTAEPVGTWNHFHISVEAGVLTVRLNNKLVNRIKLDHPNLKGRQASGSIGFQDHALPISLRSMRIRKL